jgi:hypothetical protein
MDKVIEIDALTNEVTERERTEKEIEQSAKDLLEKQALDLKAEQAESAKAAAVAKLSALGLTIDDLQALGL